MQMREQSILHKTHLPRSARYLHLRALRTCVPAAGADGDAQGSSAAGDHRALSRRGVLPRRAYLDPQGVCGYDVFGTHCVHLPYIVQVQVQKIINFFYGVRIGDGRLALHERHDHGGNHGICYRAVSIGTPRRQVRSVRRCIWYVFL